MDGMRTSDKRHPHLRSFFVDPSHARQGVASAILNHVESEIRLHAYRQVHVIATLAGVEFYRAHGYRKTGNCAIELEDGSVLPSIEMIKVFERSDRLTASGPPTSTLEGERHAKL